MTMSSLNALLSPYSMPRATDPISLRVAICRGTSRRALARRLEATRQRAAVLATTPGAAPGEDMRFHCGQPAAGTAA